ncbi:MAG: hypothetical protein KKE20_00790 [Nanoarchaeota archaeon]|nr:hypothetical protein [Nanoarchaeota archaeon]
MDINSTIPGALVPFVSTMEVLMKTVSVFVGGIFGLYIVLFLFRIYTYKRNRAFFKKMRKEMSEMHKSIERIEKKVDSMKRKSSGANSAEKKGK